VPRFIVWFGIGELPKEVLLVVGIVPITAVATVNALDEVPDDLWLRARAWVPPGDPPSGNWAVTWASSAAARCELPLSSLVDSARIRGEKSTFEEKPCAFLAGRRPLPGR
jgi:hypothetical protein